jgi:hypothetical protein
LIITITATFSRNVKTGIKMKYTIALITIFVSLVGCSEEAPEEFDRIITSTLLSNTWTSECRIEDSNSYRPILVFTSNGGRFFDSGNGTSSNLYYTGDTACNITALNPVPETRDLNTFSYSLGNDVIVDGSVAEITKATEINTTTNITEGLITFGVAGFDIFAIKDTFTLYFGNKTDTNDGTTVDLRPTQLTADPTIIYTR